MGSRLAKRPVSEGKSQPPAASVVLIDQDLPGDRRVQAVISAAPQPVRVLDLHEAARVSLPTRARDLLVAAWLVGRGLRHAQARHKQLAQLLRLQHGSTAGLLACWRSTARSVALARTLRQALRSSPSPTLIHANDLATALAVVLAGPGPRGSFVYDSHELQVHRHRRVGWLRALVEHQHESWVVEAADEVRTVNGAVAQIIHRLHPALAGLPRVVTNDVYQHDEIEPASPRELPAIVYIGRGTSGRLLEQLDSSPQALGFEVHTWLLGSEVPKGIRGDHWRRGSLSYAPEVAALVRQRRCLMWCCLDARSLSYRLATPNKMFQALALCMPIVASRGTYLAELVERHGIGAIADDDLSKLAVLARTERYETWVSNVRRLRANLRSGAQTI